MLQPRAVTEHETTRHAEVENHACDSGKEYSDTVVKAGEQEDREAAVAKQRIECADG